MKYNKKSFDCILCKKQFNREKIRYIVKNKIYYYFCESCIFEHTNFRLSDRLSKLLKNKLLNLIQKYNYKQQLNPINLSGCKTHSFEEWWNNYGKFYHSTQYLILLKIYQLFRNGEFKGQLQKQISKKFEISDLTLRTCHKILTKAGLVPSLDIIKKNYRNSDQFKKDQILKQKQLESEIKFNKKNMDELSNKEFSQDLKMKELYGLCFLCGNEGNWMIEKKNQKTYYCDYHYESFKKIEQEKMKNMKKFYMERDNIKKELKTYLVNKRVQEEKHQKKIIETIEKNNTGFCLICGGAAYFLIDSGPLCEKHYNKFISFN